MAGGLEVVIKSTSVTNNNVSLRSLGGGGRFRVVGVTTRYGVDGPGFDPGGNQTFRVRPRQAGPEANRASCLKATGSLSWE